MTQISKKKIVVLILSQFRIFVSLSLQFHGMLMVYNLLQAGSNSMVCTYLATKKINRKRKGSIFTFAI